MGTETKKTTQAEVASTRQTFDGVTVYLHADGSVSSRMEIQRRRLRAAIMWRAWQDVCLYTWRELSTFIETRNRIKREHHHSCQCERCGGRSLPRGYIAASPRYVSAGGAR